MQEVHSLLKVMLLICEFLAAFTGVIYLLRLKKSYWKWFSIYLIIVFLQECFWMNNSSFDKEYQIVYYIFLGIPLEYIFLYWLYAFKSLNNKKLFLISVLSYVIVLIILYFFKGLYEIYSLSINVGTIILVGLIILEFIKQIRNDDILKFKENKMFYINIGLILFYVGSYPFQVFGKELQESHLNVWNVYYAYFLVANCIMYLLFTASFVWGKTQL